MKKSSKQAIAVGAGVAALAAAAAGTYFFTGKNAKNRKKVAAWAGQMQKDVMRNIKKARSLSRANYHKIVDAAAKNYKSMRNVDARELAAAAAQMKQHWTAIQAEVQQAAKTVRKIKPKAAKSRARKVKVAVRRSPAKRAAKRRR